jgi:hypothetical protein
MIISSDHRSIQIEESGRFLKKAAQKLFYAGPWALSVTQPMAQHYRSFFATFCSQKEAFPFRFPDQFPWLVQTTSKVIVPRRGWWRE